jgi:RND family efflux transporter MFP subunit
MEAVGSSGALLPPASTAQQPPAAEARAKPSTYDGLLLPSRTALIKSKYDERVEEVAVRPGALVKKGQLMLRLLDSEQRVQVERTQALLEQANAKLERIRSVHKSQGISDEILEEAQTKARLARADHDMARIEYEERSILAPFDGVVAERYVDPGASVETGDPLIRVTAMTPLRVEALLPQEVLPSLSEKATIEVKLAFPDTTLFLPVQLQSVVVDPASGSFPLHLEVDNSRRRLTPGVSCRISISRVNRKAS